MIYLASSQKLVATWVPLNMRCCNKIYNQKGPIIFRTTHLAIVFSSRKTAIPIAAGHRLPASAKGESLNHIDGQS